MQLVHQNAKKFFKVAVRCDGSGHADERLVPYGQRRCCEDFGLVVHSAAPSHRADSNPSDARRSTIDINPLTLVQFGVLGFRLLVDGDFTVGVLPEIQKILVGLARGGYITHHFPFKLAQIFCAT
jgi:hypothetical protein